MVFILRLDGPTLNLSFSDFVTTGSRDKAAFQKLQESLGGGGFGRIKSENVHSGLE